MSSQKPDESALTKDEADVVSPTTTRTPSTSLSKRRHSFCSASNKCVRYGEFFYFKFRFF